MTEGARVTARGLGFIHEGGRVALRDVDLEAGAGDLIGVLGPNGSGKTTLLRLLATAAPVQTGSLEILGAMARGVPSIRRRLGFAGDVPVHADAITASESVELLGRASGLGAEEARQRGSELLARVGLGAEADSPVSSFSFGMRRRLLLAETLVHEPALILLDEPTLGLDPEGLDVLVGLLQSRAAAGACAVIATNDVAFAARVAHRVLLLHRGRVVAHGTPQSLLEQLGADAIVEVALGVPPRAVVQLPPGARLTAQTGDLLALRMPRGGGALPALLRAIEDAGAAVRAVSIREPDLSDVFRAATGEALS